MFSSKELQIILSKANLITFVAFPDMNSRIHIHMKREGLDETVMMSHLSEVFKQLGFAIERLPDPKARPLASEWMSIQYNPMTPA